MESDTAITIEERISRIEKEARVHRCISTLALVAIAGVLSVGSARDEIPERISAQSFYLVDKDQRPHGFFAMVGDSPMLSLESSEGMIRIQFLDGKNPTLTVSGPNMFDDPSIQLIVSEGSPSIRVESASKFDSSIWLRTSGRHNQPKISLSQGGEKGARAILSASRTDARLSLIGQEGSGSTGLNRKSLLIDDGNKTLLLEPFNGLHINKN